MLKQWLVVALITGTSLHASAAKLDYQLEPVKVAEDTYIFKGLTEDFSLTNGGNIVNTGFIVTDAGVIVIDTGPSRLYGEQMRSAIESVTSQPINRVVNTHHHPDHFLGNQAFQDVPVYALAATAKAMKSDAAGFTDNAYRLVGKWMKGTEAYLPDHILEEKTETIGGHDIRWLSLSGHTAGDLVVFDKTTGVVFVGDLVFHNRTATTPHADIKDWNETLSKLESLPYTLMIPGHGEPITDNLAVEQTRRYLGWLNNTLHQAAANGLDMVEAMHISIPIEFSAMTLLRSEFTRSISHLYPAIESEVFTTATPMEDQKQH